MNRTTTVAILATACLLFAATIVAAPAAADEVGFCVYDGTTWDCTLCVDTPEVPKAELRCGTIW